ncbi:hypothetical protein [Spirosoma montaniterrae]|uniref:Uncharacterized protein n=1 Tax=Spirosoma montaniterrae TaxID=1178516 RepID=A0A1P9X0H1_9BACT|nr:hypothetical protein [Spirosoma montaniterrae]AQG81129.1 hypothetical protein AWR27_18465 [Spirosoma montaniterrae]
MEKHSETTLKRRAWYQKHTEDALTQYEPKFWIIFWVTAAVGVALQYLTAEHIAPYLNQDGRFILSVSCLSLPLLALRNLHLQAFTILGISLVSIVW